LRVFACVNQNWCFIKEYARTKSIKEAEKETR